MRILYFAWLREKTGIAEETLQPPPGINTIQDLITWLQTLSPGHAAAFAQQNQVRCALDQEFAHLASAIGNATEIAFFPPVTGG
jgi:molybdopterin synthase sulfur carrier subunit